MEILLTLDTFTEQHRIVLLATADVSACLKVLANIPDEQGAALMLSVGSKRAAEVISELSIIRQLKLVRHILKVRVEQRKLSRTIELSPVTDSAPHG
jgi:Mg/Co/Ni transporter MgtE